MRKISELIWHCTATREGQEVSVKEIDSWHKARGWQGIGYHKVVHLDGAVSEARPESKIGSHVAGRNTGTLGYVYVGGVMADGKTPKDTRTPAQKKTMRRLTVEAIARYGLTMVSGHRDYAAKACPCFNARGEYAPLLPGGRISKPAPQPKPQPDSLNTNAGMPVKDPATQQRNDDIIGGSVASTSTTAATVVASRPDPEPVTDTVGEIITSTKDSIEPLVWLNDNLVWIFMAIAFAGVGWMVYGRIRRR